MDPLDHAYFGPLDLLRDKRLAIAARQTTGWYDMFCEGGLAAFAHLSASLDPAIHPQRMLIGPWSHVGAGAGVVGDHYFGPAADSERLGLKQRERAWLGSALESGPRSELGHRLSVFVLGSGDWLDFSTWPPSTTCERWPLSVSGEVLPPGCVPEASGTREIVHDPSRPLSTVGGRTFGFWPRSGPVSTTKSADGWPLAKSQVTYASEPVDRPMTVIGEISVDLVLDWIGTTVDVIVRLDCVSPDGTELLIVEQGSRLERLALGEAHRIAAGSTAWRINAGDQIRISVSMSSWPRLEVAPQERILRVNHSAPYGCAVLLPRLEMPSK